MTVPMLADIGCPDETCPACHAALTVTDTGPAATWHCGSCGWTATLTAAEAGDSR
jgi:hypothetical protein